jgi:hypothetical protein
MFVFEYYEVMSMIIPSECISKRLDFIYLCLPQWCLAMVLCQAMHTIITLILTDVELHLFKQVAEDHEKFEALQVSEVSLRSGKGRHTTRHVSLLRLPGGDGLLADTPGFSQPSLAKVMSATLGELFPEVQHSFPCAFTISSFKIR